MNFVLNLVLVAQIVSALAMVGLILMQHGKGADMGAAFGSGSSGSLFGAAGSANFLSRTTAILAAAFFLSSLGLTYLGTLHTKPKDVMQQGVMGNVPAAPGGDAPKAPAPVPAPAAPTGGAAPGGVPSKAGDVPK